MRVSDCLFVGNCARELLANYVQTLNITVVLLCFHVYITISCVVTFNELKSKYKCATNN